MGLCFLESKRRQKSHSAPGILLKNVLCVYGRQCSLMHVSTYVCTSRDQRVTLSLSLSGSILTHSFSLKLLQLSCLACKTQRSLSPPAQCWHCRYLPLCSAFYLGAGDLNSGPGAWIPNASPPDLSPSSPPRESQAVKGVLEAKSLELYTAYSCPRRCYCFSVLDTNCSHS